MPSPSLVFQSPIETCGAHFSWLRHKKAHLRLPASRELNVPVSVDALIKGNSAKYHCPLREILDHAIDEGILKKERRRRSHASQRPAQLKAGHCIASSQN